MVVKTGVKQRKEVLFGKQILVMFSIGEVEMKTTDNKALKEADPRSASSA